MSETLPAIEMSRWLAGIVARYRMPPTGNAAAIGPTPWLAELMRRYGPQAPPAHPAVTPYRLFALLLLVLGGAFAWPELHAAYIAGYPSEPAKLQALEQCGRANPTFIRFFDSERAACYARFTHSRPG